MSCCLEKKRATNRFRNELCSTKAAETDDSLVFMLLRAGMNLLPLVYKTGEHLNSAIDRSGTQVLVLCLISSLVNHQAHAST